MRTLVLAVAVAWSLVGALGAAGETPGAAKLGEALRVKRVSLEFVETPLGEALSILESKLGVRIAVGPGTDTKRPVTLRAAELPGDVALMWLARLVGARVEITDAGVLLLEERGGAAAPRGGRWTPWSGRAPVAGDEYENPTDGSILVWIPGGSFYMGRDGGLEDEAPRHKVRVKGFWLGKYEVTNKQYKRFLTAIKATGRFSAPGFWDDPAYNADDQPVAAVIWYEADMYCKWAKLRMPTEAEWEYVASGGKGYEYPTSTGSIGHDLANFAGSGGRDTWGDAPAPVGMFPPNPFGICDLAGNVWEHTSTVYREYPYSATDGRENVKQMRGTRVMRGGCWHFGAEYCSTYHRRRFESHLRYDYAGIRVAAGLTTGGVRPETGAGDEEE